MLKSLVVLIWWCNLFMIFQCLHNNKPKGSICGIGDIWCNVFQYNYMFSLGPHYTIWYVDIQNIKSLHGWSSCDVCSTCYDVMLSILYCRQMNYQICKVNMQSNCIRQTTLRSIHRVHPGKANSSQLKMWVTLSNESTKEPCVLVLLPKCKGIVFGR